MHYKFLFGQSSKLLFVGTRDCQVAGKEGSKHIFDALVSGLVSSGHETASQFVCAFEVTIRVLFSPPASPSSTSYV